MLTVQALERRASISKLVVSGAIQTFLPRVFGTICIRAEALICDLMRRSIEEWTGGMTGYAYASTADLRRAGFIYPSHEGTMKVTHPLFGTEAELTPELAGMFCTIIGIAVLLEWAYDDKISMPDQLAERLNDQRLDLLSAGYDIAKQEGMESGWFWLVD